MPDEEAEETSLARLDPWEQQPNEPKEAFLLFQKYLNLGITRTLRKLYLQTCRDSKTEPANKVPNRVKELAEKHDWVRRAFAYEESIINEDARHKAIRRAELREEEYAIARQMIDKAKDMLKFPLQQVTYTGENNQVTIINPADWRLTDVVALVKAASELSRLSLDMSQGRIEVTPVAANQQTAIDDMLWLKETVARGTEIPGVSFKVEDRPNDGTTDGKPQALPAGDTTVDRPNDSTNAPGQDGGNAAPD